MKKISKLLSIFLLTGIIISSCSKDDEEEVNPNFIRFNGKDYALTYGTIDDWGTNNDITYREYNLEFLSTNSSKPANYLELNILSTSTTRLEEGTYTYNYWGDDPGLFDFAEAGIEIEYDETGNAIAGTRLRDIDVEEGTVIVTKNGDNYKFDVTLRFEKDGVTYNISAVFSDVLHE